MYCLDLTLPTPAENLACDEALLDWCETTFNGNILRFWEPREHFVVLGYAKRAQEDAHVDRCRRRRIPILRRCSGGGTVLQGPGCLNFSLILRIAAGPLRSIHGTNAFIMERHQHALEPVLGAPITIRGATDLAIGSRKFSGNSQRRKRRAVLFHGTFLLDLDLQLMTELLPIPSQQPSYRRHRTHEAFLTNVHVPAIRLRQALQRAWQATEPLSRVPRPLITQLTITRYATDAWNLMR